MPAKLPPYNILKYANLGGVSQVGGNVQFGNNQYNFSNGNDLLMLMLMNIREVLRRPLLAEAHRTQLMEWIEALEQPDVVLNLDGIRDELMKLKDQMNDLEVTQHKKLKIWLNRSQQRADFRRRMKAFREEQEVVPSLLFCLSGDAEMDGTEDAAAMLFDNYLTNIMKVAGGRNVREHRINDPLTLINPADALYEFENILSEVVIGKVDDKQEALVQLLQEDAFRHKHLMARCRVRTWTDEGLKAFFNTWLQAFTRDRLCPFVLLLEFANPDCERLQLLVDTCFQGKQVAILPPLAEIEAQDLTDFYDRVLDLPGYSQYRDLFDEHSLTATDMPLRYRKAINKLQLKIR